MQNTRNQPVSSPEDKWNTEATGSRKRKANTVGREKKKAIKAVDAIYYILASSIVGLSILGIGLLATIIAAPAVITTETITMAAECCSY